jgi:hypothetical protein
MAEAVALGSDRIRVPAEFAALLEFHSEPAQRGVDAHRLVSCRVVRRG